MSEATALPTEPQPLPKSEFVYINWYKNDDGTIFEASTCQSLDKKANNCTTSVTRFEQLLAGLGNKVSCKSYSNIWRLLALLEKPTIN